MKDSGLFILIFFIPLFGISAQPVNVIKGKVLDKIDNEPLVGVNVLIEELKSGTVTDGNGKFELENIPSGNYKLKISYIGHKTVIINIVVPSDKAEQLETLLEEESLTLDEVVITGNPLEINPKEISKPNIILSNLDLRIKRNSTIAQTIDYQPGIAMQSNGIATSKPIIRGLSSNRILILEDGLRTGDLSNTAIDHAISEDGSSPEKIEVLRGPASLLYGSNAIGGVVNIITEIIPRTVPQEVLGEAKLEFGSVNDEKLGRIHLGYGIDKLSLHGDFFKKKTNDYKVPSGLRVVNSDYESEGFKFGVAFHPVWGVIGASINNYDTQYGIPFDQNEVGGEGPVAIDLQKQEYRVLAEMEDLNTFINSFSLKGGYKNYQHDEIELEAGTIGSSFLLNTFSGDFSFGQGKIDNMENLNGTFGLWLLNQNYKVEGEEALTPNADYKSIAAYLLEQISLGKISLNLGGRFENNRVDIPQTILYDSLFTPTQKSFNSFSGSIGLVYYFVDEAGVFVNLSNAFRAPTVEELSSYAIHAATNTFDIGDRNLDKENNIGGDLGIRYTTYNLTLEGNLYYNRIFNYIYREPSSLFYNEENETGFNDSTGFPVFFYTQDDAELYGFEFKTGYEFLPGLIISLMSDYVRGKNLETSDNLPLIPPLRFAFETRFVRDYYWFGFNWKIATEQDRVADNETTTSGYGVLDLYTGLKFITGNFIHSIDIKATNILNQNYRDHLSAIKEFAPMPGRNFSISYSFLF
ncbi:MAG: TonB-dependent receptor [Ignavibacteriales bacterium]